MSVRYSSDQAESAPAARGSRHYRRAQQDRGAETRNRLLLAALDVFGRYGFDGASTREIARRADANLAAIVYHFGSKEALHLAVAEYVVSQMRSRNGALVKEIDESLDSGEFDKLTARRFLHRLIESFVETMIGDREADLWSRFLMREQMEPSPVFDVTFAHISQTQLTIRRLIAALLDLSPDDPDVSIRAMMVIGEISIFCTAQPMVLKTLVRTEYGRADRDRILRISSENVDRIVGVTVQG